VKIWLTLLLLLSAKVALAIGKDDWSAVCKVVYGMYHSPEKWVKDTQRLLGTEAKDGEIHGMPIVFGKRADEAKVKALTEAAPVKEIIIVTHQSQRLQIETANRLKFPDLQDLPVLVLSSELFPVSRELASVATVNQMSELGALAANFDAPVVRLMGGSCNNCLVESAHSVIREMLDIRNREEVTLKFQGEFIYGDMQGTLPRAGYSLKTQITGQKPEQRLEHAREWTHSMLKGNGLKNEAMSYVSGVQRETGYEFTYRRAGGKTVKIFIDLM